MRKAFCAWLEQHAASDPKFVMLTGDLGFNALERTAEIMGPRFINAGVAEQNMVSMAAAIASQGLSTLCYSIAPFAVFRPAEQIRVDVCLHNHDVKIVGNGGGYGYGIMGATHHAIEDLAMLAAFPRMRCYIPFCDEQVIEICRAMMAVKGPAYLRLGAGTLPAGRKLRPWSPLQVVAEGQDVTVVTLGPLALSALAAQQDLGRELAIFAVTELSQLKLTPEFMESLKATRKLVVFEEHVRHGGIGEKLAALVLRAGLKVDRFEHVTAAGYPTGRYGSQDFHRRQSGLDVASMTELLRSAAG